MKNKVNVSYFLAATLGLFCVTAFLQKIYIKISSISHVSFKYDSPISMELRRAIEKQVALLEVDGRYQLDSVLHELIRLFPHIKRIDIKALPYDMAEVEITSFDPVVRVNDTHVLTQEHTIIPAHYYACYALENLPTMQVRSIIPDRISCEAMNAIRQSIKERTFESFSVSMLSEQEWHLQNKKDPLITICCNPSSIPMGSVQKRCHELIETVKKKSSPKTAWIADVRFNHQIVLSRLKGGLYGKKI